MGSFVPCQQGHAIPNTTVAVPFVNSVIVSPLQEIIVVRAQSLPCGPSSVPSSTRPRRVILRTISSMMSSTLPRHLHGRPKGWICTSKMNFTGHTYKTHIQNNRNLYRLWGRLMCMWYTLFLTRAIMHIVPRAGGRQKARLAPRREQTRVRDRLKARNAGRRD